MSDGKILLVERGDAPAKGLMWLPGGRVWKGELMRDTALRTKSLGAREILAHLATEGALDAAGLIALGEAATTDLEAAAARVPITPTADLEAGAGAETGAGGPDGQPLRTARFSTRLRNGTEGYRGSEGRRRKPTPGYKILTGMRVTV